MHSYYYDGGPGYRPTPTGRSAIYALPPLPEGPLYEDPPPLSRKARKAMRRAARRTQRRPWKAPLFFAVFLVLMIGTTAVLMSLNLQEPLFSLPEADLPVSGGGVTVPLPSFDDEEEPETTVKRAPVGTGVTLTLDEAAGTPLTLQEIYAKCSPSVVSVRSYLSGGGATGTGVVMDADGYIITNYHVIQGANKVEVRLDDDSICTALLVGGDQTNDLAVLKIVADGLVPAEFGNSDRLQVGDVALAIGNPLGEDLRNTMTDGIISAIDRDVRVDGNTMSLLQTTAALNSGNSGGALLNAYGQVVGITNMKMISYYDTIEGLGFAIPSVTTKEIVDELIANGYVGGRPTLGLTGYSLDEETAESMSLVPGVYVSSVERKSDAWRQGLRSGDVITKCQDESITSVEEINGIKAGLQAGDALSFQIYRSGRYIDMDITLMERWELDQ